MDKDINRLTSIADDINDDEEDDNMGAYAIKSSTPFVTTKNELKGKKPSQEYIERRKYINSHNFVFDINNETGELKVTISEKK